jgi:[ribosomal protein S5]-alanine N-acetyltransferase
VLAKVGFTFVKKYVTVPGVINFEQEVNRWHMSREHFAKVVTCIARQAPTCCYWSPAN